MNGLVSISKSTTVGMDIAVIVAEKWIGALSAMFGHKPVALIGVPVCVLDFFGPCSSLAERFVMGSIPIRSTNFVTSRKWS